MRGTYDTTTTHTAKRQLAPLLTRPGHMESGGEAARWRFGAANPALEAAGRQSIRSIISALYDSLDTTDPRPVAPLGHGDPSAFACGASRRGRHRRRRSLRQAQLLLSRRRRGGGAQVLVPPFSLLCFSKPALNLRHQRAVNSAAALLPPTCRASSPTRSRRATSSSPQAATTPSRS
jgi:hypothetical protein